MCKCRDTGAKRCRWEHKTDSWTKHLKSLTKQERKRQKAQKESE